jgi:hypothetical protein
VSERRQRRDVGRWLGQGSTVGTLLRPTEVGRGLCARPAIARWTRALGLLRSAECSDSFPSIPRCKCPFQKSGWVGIGHHSCWCECAHTTVTFRERTCGVRANRACGNASGAESVRTIPPSDLLEVYSTHFHIKTSRRLTLLPGSRIVAKMAPALYAVRQEPLKARSRPSA